jgi:hypothetical protein
MEGLGMKDPRMKTFGLEALDNGLHADVPIRGDQEEATPWQWPPLTIFLTKKSNKGNWMSAKGPQ